MHFIDPPSPPAGKQTPPFTAQSSKALCCVASRYVRGGGGGCRRAQGAMAQCTRTVCPHHHPGGGGGTEAELALLGHFDPPGFLCRAGEGMPHPVTQPCTHSLPPEPGTADHKSREAAPLLPWTPHAAPTAGAGPLEMLRAPRTKATH